MPIEIFFAAGAALWPEYRGPLDAALAEVGLQAVLRDQAPDPAKVDYIIFAPDGVIQDFAPFCNAKAVLNLWAGVEKIAANPTLTQPLCRMVDPAMTEGMVEFVVGHVLRHHLGMDAHIKGQDGIWRNKVTPPIARQRPVSVLGLGALGRACATALSALNFPVTGWSRSQKDLVGIRCLWGEAGLDEALRSASILVTLLPNTPDTQNLMNAARLARLPKGACVINPGRGSLFDDAALLAALDTGQIGHATFDVFRQEPLPPGHPFWEHPRFTVTPHVAASTIPESASRVIAENIRRGEAGQAFLYLVDRSRGY